MAGATGEARRALALQRLCAVAPRGLEFALRDRFIAQNPAGHLKYLKREKPIRQTPSVEEFRATVDHIRNQRFSDAAEPSADFVEFIGLAGLGQAEASSLTWEERGFRARRDHNLSPENPAGIHHPDLPAGLPALGTPTR